MHLFTFFLLAALVSACGQSWIKTPTLDEFGQDDSMDLLAINELVTKWHQASAMANEEAFFGAMAPDAVYLGTDPGERWLRDELRDWSKDAFNRPSAWSFASSQRECFLSPGRDVAWFHELLATDMGPCRGSGVLTKSNNGWFISHYNLSFVLINEKVPAFKALAQGE
ncbi:MAG: nuclear transport factor 2 family protein [Bacteroidetes bacterium]|jgi:hypothetical protein|nr:nuclear transport factor 2 family protein [Bacteroidota bacterium]